LLDFVPVRSVKSFEALIYKEYRHAEIDTVDTKVDIYWSNHGGMHPGSRKLSG